MTARRRAGRPTPATGSATGRRTGQVMAQPPTTSDSSPFYAARRQWRWDGTHHACTAEAWLHNMDRRRPEVWRALQEPYSPEHAGLWWVRWRLFFMSFTELFACDKGQQRWVAHYLFSARP